MDFGFPQYKIGEDLNEDDNLLDPITFRDVILAVHCNCRTINPDAVRETLREILDMRLDDMTELMKRNMDEVIRLAKEGRD